MGCVPGGGFFASLRMTRFLFSEIKPVISRVAGAAEAVDADDQVAKQQHDADERAREIRAVFEVRPLQQPPEQGDRDAEDHGIERETAPLEVAVVGAKACLRERERLQDRSAENAPDDAQMPAL